MNSRRNFLKKLGGAGLASLFFQSNSFSGFGENSELHPVGLQLFTFFNIIDDDVQGTLKKIADIGYLEIESAFSKKGGYYGMKAVEFRDYLHSIGLKWKSHHVLGAPFKLPPGAKLPLDAQGKPITIPPMRNLSFNMQELVDEASAGGVEYLVCANTPIHTLDEIHQSIEVLNKTGEACKKAGIGFAYHNHDAEFKEVEGKIPYDLFIKELDPATVKFELDLAWAIKGGGDPIKLFNENPGRFPLWHVKDLDASHSQILPVGSGTLNFKPIFEAASKAGMKHFFVEHDMPKDAYTSIRSSIEYIHQVLKVS